MSHLLLLTKSTQSSVEVLPALALLPHHVKILPPRPARSSTRRRPTPSWSTAATTWRRSAASPASSAPPASSARCCSSSPRAAWPSRPPTGAWTTSSSPPPARPSSRPGSGSRSAAWPPQLEGDDGESHLISSSGLVVDDATYTAKLENRTLDLTFKEFELVKFLAQHPGRVFTRQQLLQEVWGYDYFGGTRTVDVHVRRLRAKLGAEHETLIGTVRNVGYRFVAITAEPAAEPEAADAEAEADASA